MSDVLTLAFLYQVLQIAVPYALAAMGGAITERSGIIDLALEGKLLFGAFAAAACAHATGSTLAGVAGAVGAGMAVAAVQAFCALWLEADQVIIGVAINILGLAGTRFLLQLIYHEGANSPRGPFYGDSLVGNPIVWIAAIAIVVVPVALRRTRWGLRLRAAGDRPDALVAVGVSPRGARVAAALVGGALAGAGGAHLSLAVGFFAADVSNGRGYIALAMVILSGWRPALAAVCCLGVAGAQALNIQLQMSGSIIPRDLAPLLPYVLTIAVLVIWGGKRTQPPKALGKI